MKISNPIPIIELGGEQRNYNYGISLVLGKGINKCNFYILANKACQIRYNIILLDMNFKTIVQIQNQELKIQFPNYMLPQFPTSNLADLFFNNEKQLYSFDEIKLLKKEYCNSIEIHKNNLLTDYMML